MSVQSGQRTWISRWLLWELEPIQVDIEGFRVHASPQHQPLLRQGLMLLRQCDPRGFGRLHAYLMRRRGWPYEGPWRERHEKLSAAEQLRSIRRSLEFTSMPPSERAAYYTHYRKHVEGELDARYWEAGVIRHTLKWFRLSRKQAL